MKHLTLSLFLLLPLDVNAQMPPGMNQAKMQQMMQQMQNMQKPLSNVPGRWKRKSKHFARRVNAMKLSL